MHPSWMQYVRADLQANRDSLDEYLTRLAIRLEHEQAHDDDIKLYEMAAKSSHPHDITNNYFRLLTLHIIIMKLSMLLFGGIAALVGAQTATSYTDAKSGITFQAYQHTTGYFLGIALPDNPTGNTDFIATIGGKGTGWSGSSLAGPMKNSLLVLAWPNSQAVVGSFRKTA